MVHSPGRKPTGPVAPPGFERSAVGGGYLVPSPNALTMRLASTGPVPRTMPEPRYFSIPSAVVGGVVLRKSALN